MPRTGSPLPPHASALAALALTAVLVSCDQPDSGSSGASPIIATASTDSAPPAAGSASASNSTDTAAATDLFDGESLGTWERIDAYPGGGEVAIEDGAIVVRQGETLSGVRWAEDPYSLPLINYEISVEAKRMAGVDFFCGLTFPIRDLETCCTFVIGGWGGGVVGISSLDGLDAAENDTSSYHSFEENRWYRIRLQVQENRLKAWLDDKLVVNTITRGRKLSMRLGDIIASMPLGLSTYQTTAAFRNISVRPLKEDEIDNSGYDEY